MQESKVERRCIFKLQLKSQFTTLLGILPENIETISQDLFRYMLMAARVTSAMKWKIEKCSIRGIWKEKLAEYEIRVISKNSKSIIYATEILRFLNRKCEDFRLIDQTENIKYRYNFSFK